MTTTDTTATVTEITTGATRATWKQHGQPLSGFEFFGTEVKAPAAKGKAAKVSTGPNGITVKGTNNREIATFAAATKFWAIVPADAPRQETAPKPPKAAKADPIVITAAKGGDQTVPPIKGAIAQAIKDSGKSLNEISRAHGLNPSQMRRLVNDQVLKVDLVRAEVIAKALGQPVSKLFGQATAKAGAAKANGNGTTTAPDTQAAAKGRKGGQSRATKASARLVKDAEAAAAAKAAQDEAAEAPQADQDADQASQADQAAE
jgi:lambda repressor-like predicted transcriptional regulator